eukprot:1389004-Amorphochlora_amoeboformis.AAC.1
MIKGNSQAIHSNSRNVLTSEHIQIFGKILEACHGVTSRPVTQYSEAPLLPGIPVTAVRRLDIDSLLKYSRTYTTGSRRALEISEILGDRGDNFGNVTISITENLVDWYPIVSNSTLFEYLNCKPGWYTSHYNSPCLACDAGTYSNDARTECTACSLVEYQPNSAGSSCLPCMDNSQTTLSASTSLYDCLCSKNYYKIDYPNADTACKRCPAHASCLGGWEIPIPDRGYFRDEVQLDLIRKCYPKSTCVGGTNSSCEAGYTGLQCGICDHGYYHVGNRCSALRLAGAHLLPNGPHEQGRDYWRSIKLLPNGA